MKNSFITFSGVLFTLVTIFGILKIYDLATPESTWGWLYEQQRLGLLILIPTILLFIISSVGLFKKQKWSLVSLWLAVIGFIMFTSIPQWEMEGILYVLILIPVVITAIVTTGCFYKLNESN